MRRQLEKRTILAGSVAAALLLMFVGWETYQQTIRVNEAADARQQSYQVQLTLDQVAVRLVDAETGQRGYLLTGDEAYLEPYRVAIKNLDEVMGRRELSADGAVCDFYLSLCKPDTLNVHTIHAETEGMGQLEGFTALVRALKARGAEFVQLRQLAARLNRTKLPVCEIIRTTLPGRAGWISSQGPVRIASE